MLIPWEISGGIVLEVRKRMHNEEFVDRTRMGDSILLDNQPVGGTRVFLQFLPEYRRMVKFKEAQKNALSLKRIKWIFPTHSIIL